MPRGNKLFPLNLIPAPLVAITAGSTFFASAQASLNVLTPDNVLHGHASESQSVYDSDSKAGFKALKERNFQTAAQRLQSAMDELRRHNITDRRLIELKNALAWAYLGLDKPHVSQKFFDDVISRTNHLPDSAILGSALAGLAESFACQGNPRKAEEFALRAVTVNEFIYQKTSKNAHELIRAYRALGNSESQKGLDDLSMAHLRKAVTLAEQAVGQDHSDLIESLDSQAIEMQRQGHQPESEELFQRMYDLVDREARFDHAPQTSGKLTVRWHEGSLRSRQLADPEYPLKYLWVNGVRVGVTLVRSENVIGALICLSNCGRARSELALGHVQLDELAPLNKPLQFVQPIKLDMALEEEHISTLTWRRPWLNHIEKTRRIPGFIKDGQLDVDNFFGSNTFGAYGNWGSIAETRTPLVTREQYLYGFMGQRKLGDLASFLSSSSSNYAPAYLDVGDSKTGLVFYGHERFEKAVLKIPVGNIVFEFPFNSAGPR